MRSGNPDSTCRFAPVGIGLAAALLPLLAVAQLAPVVGTHYAARASDTGFAGAVNSQGAYGASVPLDLPAAHGGLPVPVQVVYGGRQVGAAGMGWDVPLSFLFRNTTIAHRRPKPQAALVAPEQLSLTLFGEHLDLVRSAANTAWVARRGTEQLEVRANGDGAMVAYDGNGLTYVFSAVGATAGSRLDSGNLYLLKDIVGPGVNSVHLEYAIGAPALPGGGNGLSINLASASYNPHPTIANCFKNKVLLNYDTATTAPLAMSVLNGAVLTRVQKLSSIDVNSKATCADAAVSLRKYTFSYQSDADTQRPQLQAVTMIGQNGTAERSVTLPVATYSYGTVVDPATHQITYEKSQTVGPPFLAGVSTFVYGIGYSLPITSTEPHAAEDFVTDLTTMQTLVDLNGDGRPDFFDEAGFYQNTPDASGISQFSAGTSSPGTLLLRDLVHSAIHNGANKYDRATGSGVNDTLRMQIDMNGDGRLDVVETVLPDIDHWIIHLNTPDPTDAKKIVWVDVTIPVTRMRAALNSTGLIFGRVPMARNRSVQNIFAHCWFWEGLNGRWQEDAIAGCPEIPANYSLSKTIAEFELRDVNGDGYPDFVFNASTVNVNDPVAKPPIPSNPVNLQSASTLVAADMAGSRDIKVLINTAGAHLANNVDLFAVAPVILEVGGSTGCGIARWEPDPSIVATDTRVKVNQLCALEDVNGDGLVDRITTTTQNGQVTTTAALGTGDLNNPFSASATIALPGPIGRTESPAVNIQKTDWQTPCNRRIDAVSYDIQRTRGLRDINGDGIPDYVSATRSASGSVSWTVAMATGTGFTAPIAVVSEVGLELSLERNFCPHPTTSFVPVGTSSTPTGLYDIDGDGQPEVVTLISSGPTIPHWDVYQLKAPIAQLDVGSTASVPAAGRLIAIDNGYGAITRIGYRSAKDDTYSAHNVPYPETVVTSKAITDADFNFLGAITRYAYGNAGLIFDSARDAFVFPGYQRSVVSMLTNPTSDATLNDGMATLTDAYGLAPFVAGTNAAARFKRYLKTGSTSDVTTLSGTIGNDPWVLLATNIGNDPRRIAATHYDWDARLLAAGPAPANNERCLDVISPYAFDTSNDLGDDQCTVHGFAFESSRFSYRGTPGSADAITSPHTVQTSSTVTAVDDFGRVTSARNDNDLVDSSDDQCIQTKYATPTGANERVLNAPAVRKITTCVTGGAHPVTLAKETWEYDGKRPSVIDADGDPKVDVSSGFATARIVSRLDEAGSSLGDIRVADITFDATGNPLTVVRTRDDGATQTATATFDPFGLVPVSTAVTATNADGSRPPALTSTTTYNNLTLDALSSTDPNNAVSSHTFDGFGRVLLTKVTPTGGSEGVLSSITYNGFAIGQTGGRNVVQKVFTDPVPVTNVGTAVGRTGTTFLDSLGRELRTEAQLGTDYANKKVIVGERLYDSLGRVGFVADPFLSTDNDTTTYGTTQFFNTDGTLSCAVRGKGKQLNTFLDEVNETYPTCFDRRFENDAEIVDTRDAATYAAGSDQFGTIMHTQYTAIGRTVLTSTEGSAGQLERATFAYDAFGRMTVMTRFANPNSAAGGTTTTWHYDSLGWMTKLEELDNAPQFRSFDNWGEVTSSQWCDATFSTCPSAATTATSNRSTTSRYDALGRMIHSEDKTKGTVDPETINDFVYDVGVNNTTPPLTATNVKGRLAKATSPTSTVSFSYEGFGRVSAQVFTDRTAGSNNIYVQKQDYHGDGSPQTLHLLLPDNAFKDEKVDYAYDSAGRTRSVKYNDGANQDLFTASGNADIYDVLGRIRTAKYGTAVFTAAYADIGRNLLNQVKVTSPGTPSTPEHSRTIQWAATGLALRDPVGRELERLELVDGASNGLKTTSHYDPIGRLASARTIMTGSSTAQSDRQFTYDPLGNILSQTDNLASPTGSVALTYQTATNSDRDRICSVGYSGPTPPGACNVRYDGMGNIVSLPARAGTRKLTYFANGQVKTIANGSTNATFDYDAFGAVQRLTLNTPLADKRHDQHFGGFISRRDEGASNVVTRTVPGPGLTATRHGPTGSWTFTFGEGRGNRFVTDESGVFVQDISYQPFGEATSTGAAPGTQKYTSEQWNQGDALAALGLSQLGARIYDPVIGRFLSRDPLVIPRTAATTNPYAFAYNDPVNSSDPSGLVVVPTKCEKECEIGHPTPQPGIDVPDAPTPSEPTPSPTPGPAPGPAPGPTPGPTPSPTPGPTTSGGGFPTSYTDMGGSYGGPGGADGGSGRRDLGHGADRTLFADFGDLRYLTRMPKQNDLTDFNKNLANRASAANPVLTVAAPYIVRAAEFACNELPFGCFVLDAIEAAADDRPRSRGSIRNLGPIAHPGGTGSLVIDPNGHSPSEVTDPYKGHPYREPGKPYDPDVDIGRHLPRRREVPPDPMTDPAWERPQPVIEPTPKPDRPF